MYTRSKFEVITSVSLLRDKVEYLNQVTEMERPGVITMLEADSYVPFVEEVGEDGRRAITLLRDWNKWYN